LVGAECKTPAPRRKCLGVSPVAGNKTLEGTKKIYTNVEKDNLIGSAFYKAKGFIVFSEFDDDFKGHLLKTVRLVLDM
jgi:hypothetical protein